MCVRRRSLICASAIAGLLSGLGWGTGEALARAHEPTAAGAAANVPAEVAADLPAAHWAGSGRMRFFTFSLYDATLWVASGFSANRYAQSAFALQLHYLRALDGSAIAQRSLEEMRKTAGLTPAQEQSWLAAMQDAFPDVKAGDRITGLHQPGVGARFWLNGVARSSIADPEFSRLFFGIWLADTTPDPRLRAALLARTAP